MGLKTLLEKAGEDINAGIKLILPFTLAADIIISIFNPPLGAVINVALLAVTSAENHFSGLPKSGPQKLAWALIIAEPIIKDFVPDGVTAEKLVSDLAYYLNSYDETGKPLQVA
jgi:hypothetical protein